MGIIGTRVFVYYNLHKKCFSIKALTGVKKEPTLVSGRRVMNNLRKRTAFLLIDHRRIFNQNPSKRALMEHIKALQGRVDALEKIVEGVVYVVSTNKGGV